MKENINCSLVSSCPPDQEQKEKRTHAERGVKLNDTIIKKLKVRYKNCKKALGN